MVKFKKLTYMKYYSRLLFNKDNLLNTYSRWIWFWMGQRKDGRGGAETITDPIRGVLLNVIIYVMSYSWLFYSVQNDC